MFVVAVDGPAGSGKSTVARAVGERLGVPVLETGAMYRAVAVAALHRGLDLASGPDLARLAQALAMEVASTDTDTGAEGPRVTVDGTDVSDEIRGGEVGRVVSVVAAHAGVRSEMVRRQREWAAANGGGVIEGRDIGTVVFPDAGIKIFLTASTEERARRRSADEQTDDLVRRDHLDSTRAASPLKVADDAMVIDTTGRPVDEVVDEIVRAARLAAGSSDVTGGEAR